VYTAARREIAQGRYYNTIHAELRPPIMGLRLFEEPRWEALGELLSAVSVPRARTCRRFSGEQWKFSQQGRLNDVLSPTISDARSYRHRRHLFACDAYDAERGCRPAATELVQGEGGR
jgi:hypothetical protein